MAPNIITLKQINEWLDDLDSSLKDRVMQTSLSMKGDREELYNLYQAAQLLRARMLADFTEEVEFNNNRYDSTN